jgi:site-specific recombinase XerD
MRYFGEFLGEKQDIQEITADDLRRFIVALQRTPKFRHHPFNRPQEAKLSAQSIKTYARAIRAFFGYLYREELISKNPMQRVKMPKVPTKVVSTFSAVDIEKLLSTPDKSTGTGFRNHALMLTFVDTAARLSEITGLKLADIDLDNGYLRVMGKGEKERFIPIGHKVSKALLKYKLKFRPEPVGTEAFWLSANDRALTGERIEKIIANFGKVAGLKRCYPHKLRHTSSVLYLRNSSDPFSLQKKLGHSSLQMTRHYSNLADSDVKAMHMKYGVADKLNV